MIAKEELRIGNLVTDSSGFICEIKEIRSGTVKVKYPSDKCLHSLKSFSEIFSIQLTEELLLKLGFKKCMPDIQNDHGLSHYYNPDDTFRVKRVYGGYILRELRGHLITIKEYDASHNYIIRFVHQIQNLYHALTGEELQITL